MIKLQSEPLLARVLLRMTDHLNRRLFLCILLKVMLCERTISDFDIGAIHGDAIAYSRMKRSYHQVMGHIRIAGAQFQWTNIVGYSWNGKISI
jgi:hypothetical protein